MDDRERTALINQIQEYRGAPIAVPDSGSRPVELPKPTLDRDDAGMRTVRLRFEPRDVPAPWTERFNRDAGGPFWPAGLPIPRVENDCIEIARLAVADVPRYVQALRRHIAATNAVFKLQRLSVQAHQRDAEAAAGVFDAEFEKAQRFIDTEFGVSATDAAARPRSPHAA